MALSSFPVASLLGSTGARVSGVAGSGSRVLHGGALGAPCVVWHPSCHLGLGISVSSLLQLCHQHTGHEVTSVAVVDSSRGLGCSAGPLASLTAPWVSLGPGLCGSPCALASARSSSRTSTHSRRGLCAPSRSGLCSALLPGQLSSC